MCGMAGVVSTNIIPNEIEIMRRMFFLNVFRGEDSVGMFDVTLKAPPGDQVIYWKSTAHPISFIKDTYKDTADDKWKKTKPNLIAGHCRAATQGKIIQKNAHPFVNKNLIGMHNGTVPKDFTNRSRFDTDSEAIFYNISTLGLKDALLAMEDAEPAFALVWYHFENRTINFLRNTKRPLHYNELYSGSTIMWSSEGEHIKYATESCTAFKNVTPTMFPEGKLHTLCLEDPKFKFEVTDIPEAKEKPKVYTVSNTSTQYDYLEHWAQNNNNVAYRIENDPKYPEYWLKYGKEINTPAMNWDTYSEYDDVSGMMFTPSALTQLKEARLYAEVQKVRRENAAHVLAAGTSTVVPLHRPFEPDKELPWDEQSPVSNNLSFTFGVFQDKICSGTAYLQKISKGCACCGQEVSMHDQVFWMTDDELICDECAQDIHHNRRQHWLVGHGGMTEQTMERICSQYEDYICDEDDGDMDEEDDPVAEDPTSVADDLVDEQERLQRVHSMRSCH